jgi:hypothetical protein
MQKKDINRLVSNRFFIVSIYTDLKNRWPAIAVTGDYRRFPDTPSWFFVNGNFRHPRRRQKRHCIMQPLVGQLGLQGYDKVGVAIDIRGGDSVAMLPLQLDALRERSRPAVPVSRCAGCNADQALLGNAAPASAGQRPADADRSHCRRTDSPCRADGPRSSYRYQRRQSQRTCASGFASSWPEIFLQIPVRD